MLALRPKRRTLELCAGSMDIADGHFAARLCLRLGRACVASETLVTLAS